MTQPGAREGFITERMVLTKLLEMGLDVAEPVVDEGHDFLVWSERRCATLQVKGVLGREHRFANKLGRKYPYHAYVFTTKRGWRSDFFILHAKTHDVWWVIPGASMKTQSSVTLFADPAPLQPRKRWYEEYREAWHLIGEALA